MLCVPGVSHFVCIDYIPDAKTEGPDGRGVITRTEFAISDSGQKQKVLLVSSEC